MILTTFISVAAAAALAGLYGARYAAAASSAAKSLVKTLSVALLALAGFLASAPWLIVLGLALGAAGDWCLSRDRERAFLAGMGAFAAGHLAYAAALWMAGDGIPALWPALAVLALGISTEAWLAPRTGTLRWPVRGYVAVIILMTLTALTLPPSARLITLGALFFVLSDALLALDLFVLRPGPAWLARTLWAAYWGGQALILWGSLGLAL